MTYKLLVKEEARLEIIEAFLYYESQQTGLGLKFTEHIEKYFHIIQDNPLLYQISKFGFREAYIRKFPFLIIYETVKDTVLVYSIFNTRRNPEDKP